MKQISKAAVLSVIKALQDSGLPAILLAHPFDAAAPTPDPDAPSGCGRCGNPSIFRPDDDAPATYVCDECGSVTDDNGRNWSPSIFDQIYYVEGYPTHDRNGEK